MLQPLRGKILVEVLEDHKRTGSGLYIAQTTDEVPHRGRVISMGAPFMDNKGREKKWGFKEGHIVHFNRIWDQNKVKNYILKREQIFAVECNDEAYGFADYVIVKRIYTGRIGDSSLIIPETYGVQSNIENFYGEVISVGAEDRLQINVGDKLIYSRNEGLSVKIPLKEELWALKPRAVLAKL